MEREIEKPRFMWTAQNKEQFLELLRQYGNISHAEREIGCPPGAAYQRRYRDGDFAKEWDDALRIATDGLEFEARRRAVEGVDEPVYYQGMECGVKRVYSDALLALLLRAHRPEKFRDNSTIQHAGEVTQKVVVLHGADGGSPFPDPVPVDENKEKKPDDRD